MKKLLLFAFAATVLFACDKGPEYKASPSTMDLSEGDTQKIVITPAPEADYPVTFSSADPAIASVSVDGTVTAVAKGTTKVTSSCEKTKFTYETTVNVSEVTYTFMTSSKSIAKGQTFQLTILPTPPAGAFVYASADPTVATVSETGLVTAVKKGNVNITATNAAKNVTLTAAITVTDASYKLNYTSMSMYVGFFDTLRVVPTPPDNSFVLTSTDPSIVTIDAGGRVIAKAPGTATLKATWAAEGIELTCSFESKAIVEAFVFPILTWDKDSTAIKAAETHPFLKSSFHTGQYSLAFAPISAELEPYNEAGPYYYFEEGEALPFATIMYSPFEKIEDVIVFHISEGWLSGGENQEGLLMFLSPDKKSILFMSQEADEEGDIFCQVQKYSPPSGSPKSLKDLKPISLPKR